MIAERGVERASLASIGPDVGCGTAADRFGGGGYGTAGGWGKSGSRPRCQFPLPGGAGLGGDNRPLRQVIAGLDSFP